MDEKNTTISQRYKELPETLQQYARNEKWIDEAKAMLGKHSLAEQQQEEVIFEVLMYLLALQNKEEFIKQVKDTLPSLPGPISGMIAQELIRQIPENVHSAIANIFAEMPEEDSVEKAQQTDSAQPQQTPAPKPNQDQNDVPKNLPGQTQSESQAGVDIITEEPQAPEEASGTMLGRHSLINSIEHPEQAEQVDRQSQQIPQKPSDNRPAFNPIASKLGDSTNKVTERSEGSSYGEGDPYREPIE